MTSDPIFDFEKYFLTFIFIQIFQEKRIFFRLENPINLEIYLAEYFSLVLKKLRKKYYLPSKSDVFL